MPKVPKLTPEQEKALWDKRELNMDSSWGLSRAVIFYLIKCFALWQGRDLRQLETNHITFGEDDLGLFVAIDFESIPLKQKRKNRKRYDDPANPRSVYKIFKKYRSFVVNEGPFLVRPIASIKDFICYSPLPLGLGATTSTIFTLLKDAGFDATDYGNYSLNMQAVGTLRRFGTGSHCLAPWVLNNGLKGMPSAPQCGPINCEEVNPEISVMISRLLDAPYPEDAVEIIQKIELEAEMGVKSSNKSFHSWMSNLTSIDDGKCKVDIGKRGKNKSNAAASSNEDTNLNKHDSLLLVNVNDNTTRLSEDDLSSSHSTTNHLAMLASHCLANLKTNFRISSISSISESAFAAQVDEAGDVELAHSVENSKINSEPQAELHASSKQIKKDDSRLSGKNRIKDDSCGLSLRQSSTKNPTVLSCIAIDHKEDNLNSDVSNVKKSSSGEEVDTICKTSLVEVKTEQSDSFEDNSGDMQPEELIDGSSLSQRSYHQKNSRLEDNSYKLKLHISNHQESKLESHDLSKKDKTNHDSIFVLREMRCHSISSVGPISGGDAEASKTSDCSEKSVIPHENDSQTPSIHCRTRRKRRLSLSTQSEEKKSKHKDDFTSPPILSPEIAVSFPHHDNSDANLETDETKSYNSKNAQKVSVASTKLTTANSSSLPSVSPTPSLITFLDNAHRHIENLLQSSSVTCNNRTDHAKGRQNKEKSPDRSLKCSRANSQTTGSCEDFEMSESELPSLSEYSGSASLRSNSLKQKNDSVHSSHQMILEPEDLDEGNVDATLLGSRNSATKSTLSALRRHIKSGSHSIKKGKYKNKVQIPQTLQQHSLLRSVLENPSTMTNENNTHSSIILDLPSTSSMSLTTLPSPIRDAQSASSSMLSSLSTHHKRPKTHNQIVKVTQSSTPIQLESSASGSSSCDEDKTPSSPSQFRSHSNSSHSYQNASDSDSPDLDNSFVSNSSHYESTQSPDISVKLMLHKPLSLSLLKQSLISSSPSLTTKTDKSAATLSIKHDKTDNAIFRTLEVTQQPDSNKDIDIEMYNFADIPNTPRSSSVIKDDQNARCSLGSKLNYKSDNGENVQGDSKAVCVDVRNRKISEMETTNKSSRSLVTSAINLGDYFPPGTLIPASSIQILTQEAENGSEVIMKFGFTQNS